MLTDLEVEDLAKRMNIPFGGCYFKDEIPLPIQYNKVYVINLEDSETEEGNQNSGTHWVMLYCKETKNGSLQPIYFDAYGAPPPQVLLKIIKKQTNKHLPHTIKDIQSLMNNACGFYCLALGHYITASKYRTGNLYEDVDDFMDMFDDLNHSIDFKKNEYILKHFFLSEDPSKRKPVDNLSQGHDYYEKIIDEDVGNGIDAIKLNVDTKIINDKK